MDFREKLLQMLNAGMGLTYDYQLCGFSEELYSSKQAIPILYRYMPANYHNIRALETGNIYLSEAGKMNDLFEGLSVYINEEVRKKLSELHDLAYLKSFSESFNDLIMWGQYADNYSGLCIEYDLRNMSKHKDYYWHLFPVCYRSDRYIGIDYSQYTVDSLIEYRREPALDDADFLRDVLSYFLVKPIEWEKEKEWRIIVPYLYMHEKWCDGGVIDSTESPYYYSIDSQTIDFPYATKVFMGARIPQLQRDHVIEICKRKKIRVYETRPSLEKFEIEYKEID